MGNHWLTQEVLDECKKAEKWWVKKMPMIMCASKMITDEWLRERIEIECKSMWTEHEKEEWG